MKYVYSAMDSIDELARVFDTMKAPSRIMRELDKCITCNIKMDLMIDGSYGCDSCGYTTNILIESDNKPYTKYTMPFNCNPRMSTIFKGYKEVNCSGSDYNKNRNEFNILRDRYNNVHAVKIPEYVTTTAANLFSLTKQYGVKRAKKKSEIVSLLLGCARQEEKLMYTKTELAEFVRLPTKSTSNGRNYLQHLYSEGKIPFNINADHKEEYVNTKLMHLKLDTMILKGRTRPPQSFHIKEACLVLIDQIIYTMIAKKSVKDTIYSAVIYIIQRRCIYNEVINITIDNKVYKLPLELDIYCKIFDKTRPSTLINVIKEVNDPNNYKIFRPLYKKYGLIYSELMP